jgi:hypothetical protein
MALRNTHENKHQPAARLQVHGVGPLLSPPFQRQHLLATPGRVIGPNLHLSGTKRRRPSIVRRGQHKLLHMPSPYPNIPTVKDGQDHSSIQQFRKRLVEVISRAISTR